MPVDYYDYLDVSSDASAEDVREAYRSLVKKRHPDVGGSDIEMKALTEARDVLESSKPRKAYDRLGHTDYVHQFGGVLFHDESPETWERVSGGGNNSGSGGASSAPTQEPDTGTSRDERDEEREDGVGDRSKRASARTQNEYTTTGTTNQTRSRQRTTTKGTRGGSQDPNESYANRQFEYRRFCTLTELFTAVPMSVLAITIVFGVVGGAGALFGSISDGLIGMVGGWSVGWYGVVYGAVVLLSIGVVDWLATGSGSDDTHARPFFTTYVVVIGLVFTAPTMYAAVSTGFMNLSTPVLWYISTASVVSMSVYYGALFTVFFQTRFTRVAYATMGVIVPAAFATSVFTPIDLVSPIVQESITVPLSSVSVVFSVSVITYAVYAAVTVFVGAGVIIVYEWSRVVRKRKQ